MSTLPAWWSGGCLSQVRDLLGHASIVTTERYDNQKQEALFEAVQRLETGECFKNLSRVGSGDRSDERSIQDEENRKLLNELENVEHEDGVSDGDRTRNVRSHSPVLYH